MIDPATSALYGPWDTYTPAWTGATSNPAIVNGSITGRFRRAGSTGFLEGFIAAGSSTTFGLGVWSISLPSGWTCKAPGALYGWLYHPSGVGNQPVGVICGTGATTLQFTPTGGGNVHATNPFTWVANDQLCWAGVLELQT